MASWWKVDSPANLLVVYDDSGSAALGDADARKRKFGRAQRPQIDHRMPSGTDGYPRLRVGIGRGREAIDHVSAPFAPEEQPAVDRVIAAAAEGVSRWLSMPFERSSEWVNSWKEELHRRQRRRTMPRLVGWGTIGLILDQEVVFAGKVCRENIRHTRRSHGDR